MAVTGTVFLIGDVLFGLGPAGLIAALTAGWFAWFWYGLPVFQQSRSDQRESGAAPGARAEQESR
ncbi:MAG: hypothetical protein H0X16_01715 [Chloroflexi bacterium]|nr:hypothetical protein [Chloroflexota bacterium]